jgi:molybdopterin converting factor small subunit
MPVVYIPALLRQFSGGRDAVRVSGSTLGEALAHLEELCPGIGAHLLDKDAIRPKLAVAIDSEVIEGWDSSRVDEGSEIYFVIPQSGG